MHHGISPSQDVDLFGLVYGSRFRSGEAGREIDSATTPACLRQAREEALDKLLWLHLNPAHAACERWMKKYPELPDYFFESLHEGPRSTRIEHVDSVLLAVVNDVVFNFGLVFSDAAILWVRARSRLLVSARAQPLRSVDKLRSSAKHGEPFRSPLQLLIHLLCGQGDVLTQVVCEISVAVDHIGDQLLALHLSANRTDLGAMWHVPVRLQRLLALESGSLLRLLNRPPEWLQDADLRELREATEEFSLVISDLTILGERIKLLQEEITAKLNEQNNRIFFILTMVMVLALLINTVVGFFGMNVGGIPLADDPEGFWIMLVSAASFTFLAGHWAFRKRGDY